MVVNAGSRQPCFEQFIWQLRPGREEIVVLGPVVQSPIKLILDYWKV